MDKFDQITTLIKILFTVGGLFAIGWFVVRPMVRTWQQQPDLDAMMPKLMDLPEEELQIPLDPNDRKKPDRNQMLKELRSDPTRVAMHLKRWIAEKEKKTGRKPRS
jgi:hypothetical protein